MTRFDGQTSRIRIYNIHNNYIRIYLKEMIKLRVQPVKWKRSIFRSVAFISKILDWLHSFLLSGQVKNKLYATCDTVGKEVVVWYCGWGKQRENNISKLLSRQYHLKLNNFCYQIVDEKCFQEMKNFPYYSWRKLWFLNTLYLKIDLGLIVLYIIRIFYSDLVLLL